MFVELTYKDNNTNKTIWVSSATLGPVLEALESAGKEICFLKTID